MVVSWENEGPESGEFFFHGKLRQKISLNARKGAQNWPSQHVNSHFLIDQPRTSALGAAVELLFCLPPVWESSSSHLGFQLNCISQLDFFHICFIFVFLRSGCLRLSSESARGHIFLSVWLLNPILWCGSPFYSSGCVHRKLPMSMHYSGNATVPNPIDVLGQSYRFPNPHHWEKFVET